MGASSWTTRLYDATETATWMVKLNLWWWLFTLLGLGLLGAGPATATAAIMVRRRGAGESPHLRDFAHTYRREFVSASAALTPAVIVLVMLGANLLWFSAAGQARGNVQAAVLVALVVFGAACCYLGPLYAFYDLRSPRYITQAVRVALARPLWTVLMALVTAAIIFASHTFPVLVPVISIGAWLHTCTWLGLRFFAENEDRRAADGPSDEPLLPLPREPLRMH